MSKRWCFAILLVTLPLACAPEESDPSIEPNASLRTLTEQVPVAAPTHGDRRVNAHNRLMPAESLVGGFEVPAGLRLLEARSDHLLFELQANTSQIQEFYTGVDHRTANRFSMRAYQLDVGKNGFDVQHTASTIDRLDLPAASDRGHIFVRAINRKVHHLRVHPPTDKRRQAVASSHAFRTLSSPEPAANTQKKTPASTDRGNSQNTRPTPFRVTSSGQPFRGSTEKKSARPHPRQDAPYGRGKVENLRNTIRQWKLENPDKEFQD